MLNEYLSNKLKIISFLSMISVVFLHSYNLGNEMLENTNSDKGVVFFLQYFVSEGICRVAVPIFFTISGYLFFIKNNGTFIEYTINLKKRFKTLVVPYLFWSVSFFLFFLAMQLIPQTRLFFKQKLIIDYTSSEVLNSIFINPIPFQFWFIRDLFVFVLLSPLLYFLLKYLKILLVVFLLGLWYIHFDFKIFSCEALLFFALGSFFGINKYNLEKIRFTKYSIHLILIWLVLIFLETVLVNQGYVNNYLIHALHKSNILVGIFGIWAFYDFVFEKSKIFKGRFFSFASMSFFVYAFHEPLLEIIKVVFYRIIGKSQLSMLCIYIISPILIISISIALGIYLKRFLPNFFKVITGGR